MYNRLANFNLYIDESGDLGFSERSSRFFVVAYLIVESFGMDKKLKRLLKKLHERKDYARKCNELKFANSKDAVRREVLQTIACSNVEIGFAILQKEKVKPKLREKPATLYNYIVIDNIMRNVLPRLTANDRLYVVVDRSLGKLASDAFNRYALSKASWLLTVEWQNQDPIRMSNIEILHKHSESDPCLQAADFLAGACYHRFEHKNDLYYRIIEGHVKHYNFLWD